MMNLDQVIYCLESYQPDAADDMCQKCKYYASEQIDEQTSVCKSSEARKVAISTIEQIKAIRVIVECCENTPVLEIGKLIGADVKEAADAAKVMAYERIAEIIKNGEKDNG